MIEEKYNHLCATSSDINEHLPTLKKYASECDSIVELGVRYIVSTWAFLAGKPKNLLSIDIVHPKEFGADIMEVFDAANDADINFSFKQASSLEVELPKHDLLFIDTLHKYDQLSQELAKHHDKAQKYIIMHDTFLAGDDGEGMRRAVNEFLDAHPEWEIIENFENNNGLTVCKRI